ncbi:ATP-binding protein [Anaeromusa sp.]|jgi:serine/threonine-protein kinase RsbW|uniref:ATP-binding protein n=1 Tax=Anaeromusa sp. TaxID=1872520 RepID=UPI002618520F|nr:ATP-binding protein [Anaeromusa sp.]MDD3158968.1 ATP-binding protein [Anaeromusa sp.]MEA4834908.1 ATP-binding protein [Anaeromusa sp.]
MSSTTASRIFAAQDENVPAITAFITEQAELAGVSPKRILQLELVIEEVVVNICHYAYEVPPGEIVIRTYCEEDKFGIEFEDGGIPFDPLAAAEPDLKAGLNEREAGGLGIFLVRRMTDEVHYRRMDGQNVLAVAVSRL